MGGITQGIVVGALGALVWLVAFVLAAAPWLRDRFPDRLLDLAATAAFIGVTVPLWQHSSGLADRHGVWVGYGSVFGSAAVTFLVIGLIVRRFLSTRAWDVYDVPVGRVRIPAAKSRRG